MERDDETSGNGNHYTTYFRQYDPRLGRWWSNDPITHSWESPYVAMYNNPVNIIDPLGAEGDPVSCPECNENVENPEEGHTYTTENGRTWIYNENDEGNLEWQMYVQDNVTITGTRPQPDNPGFWEYLGRMLVAIPVETAKGLGNYALALGGAINQLSNSIVSLGGAMLADTRLKSPYYTTQWWNWQVEGFNNDMDATGDALSELWDFVELPPGAKHDIILKEAEEFFKSPEKVGGAIGIILITKGINSGASVSRAAVTEAGPAAIAGEAAGVTAARSAKEVSAGTHSAMGLKAEGELLSNIAPASNRIIAIANATVKEAGEIFRSAGLLSGKNLEEVTEYLSNFGFKYHSTSKGGYVRFYGPGTKQTRLEIQIRPNKQVVRLQKMSNGTRRYDSHGKITQDHENGEFIR